MAANNEALERACDGIASTVVSLSLHTEEPGGSGTTGELSGGSYTRESVTYAASVNGTADFTSDPVFGAGSSEATVTYVGFWATGPTYLGSALLSASKTISGSDTLTLTSAPITVSAA